MGEPRGARTTRAPIALIDGDALRRAFAAGTEALRNQADAINAINVFPVPDGDTGTNMHQTMRAALDDVRREPSLRACVVARAAARGALMGAKGNSGVILSQILAGCADAVDGVERIGARGLAEALDRARAGAYRVVSEPKEGTILTAISAAAVAGNAAAKRGHDAEETLAAAVAAAEEAVARTPELLPVLKEAGVVDSGAQGLFVLLEGMLGGLRGERTAEHAGGFGSINAAWLGATQRLHEHDGASGGFCTEFVISGDRIDADAVRERLRTLGESLLVVGGGDAVHVHVHTSEPQAALAVGRAAGSIVSQKVDDLRAQVRALASRGGAEAAPPGGVGVIAVGAGDGIEALFQSMGASVVRGGQTMNPSAGEIREAVEGTGAASVIVLPNNKNIVMAARQAVEGLPLRATVIETRSVPEGVAALVALNTEAPFDENVEQMRSAAAGVRHAEVTRAARATKLHRLDVQQGQPIGMVDGDLRVAEATVGDAVTACVALMLEGREAPLVTLFAGDGEDEASANAVAQALRARFGCDVEVVMGGQPHYPYLIGVE